MADTSTIRKDSIFLDAAREYRIGKNIQVIDCESDLLSNLQLCAQFAEIARLQSDAFDRDGLIVTAEKFFAHGRLAHAALKRLRECIMDAAPSVTNEQEARD